MVEKAVSKSDQIRALREARANRKVQVGGIAPSKAENTLQGWADIIGRKNPEAKATKGKAVRLGKREASRKTPVTPADGVASRLRAGRTAQDRGGVTAAVAIQKRGPGRPKIVDKRPWELAGVSRRTWYRQQERSK